jgi:hypothetical protein
MYKLIHIFASFWILCFRNCLVFSRKKDLRIKIACFNNEIFDNNVIYSFIVVALDLFDKISGLKAAFLNTNNFVRKFLTGFLYRSVSMLKMNTYQITSSSPVRNLLSTVKAACRLCLSDSQHTVENLSKTVQKRISRFSGISGNLVGRPESGKRHFLPFLSSTRRAPVPVINDLLPNQNISLIYFLLYY